MATIDDFEKLDIRVGTIIQVSLNLNAKKKSYKLVIDFGSDIGLKTSSARITDLYQEEELINIQVICVVNFPPRQVANVKSEVLVLGVNTDSGVVLLEPNKKVLNGEKIS